MEQNNQTDKRKVDVPRRNRRNRRLPDEVFKDENGVWKSRKNGRMWTHDPATHEPPRADLGHPPITPSGAFMTIPKALRQFTEPAPEPRNDSLTESVEPQTQEAIEDAPQSTSEPQEDRRLLESQTKAIEPQPAQTLRSEPQEDSGEFPDYSADVTAFEGFATANNDEGSIGNPQNEPVAQEPQKRNVELPVAAFLVDTLMRAGEKMGGVKAPSSGETMPIDPEDLREMMIESINEFFPSAGNFEMGPKTRLAMGFGGYFAACYAQKEFRESMKPAALTFRQRFWSVLFNLRMKFSGWRASKNAAKAELRDQKKPQTENTENA